ncbi:MAG: orotidine-5'-phosphate decarboxylase [Bacteroidales bacterium]|nr:orotidine-5'-phosphate decarboxylase [Bacteroidales bacterium]HNW73783.1 orotidine-5'-phosphate decarboxylase [Bacteroidales bacterium]HPS50507.1 orotidine-5'-phosphate decarboxylase [Bacteroidales bacterium]
MERKALIDLIFSKKTFLCIGLDTDISKVPVHLLEHEDPVFEFNRQIIDATHDLVIAYKPNFAFYEAAGIKGLTSLAKTIQYLNKNYRDQVFTIADAKRGDIGNTSQQYARAVFDESSSGMNFDAVTVAPYMGEDSVKPFLSYPDKWIIVLALTSNKGAEDFQFFQDGATRLFERVLINSQQWGNPGDMMYVVGATQAEMLTRVRALVPDHFLLVPGVGAQGGSLQQVIQHGMTRECGLIVNSSRNIIYASKGIEFADAARLEARRMQSEMSGSL